jgi:hypothetical protein
VTGCIGAQYGVSVGRSCIAATATASRAGCRDGFELSFARRRHAQRMGIARMHQRTSPTLRKSTIYRAYGAGLSPRGKGRQGKPSVTRRSCFISLRRAIGRRARNLPLEARWKPGKWRLYARPFQHRNLSARLAGFLPPAKQWSVVEGEFLTRHDCRRAGARLKFAAAIAAGPCVGSIDREIAELSGLARTGEHGS